MARSCFVLLCFIITCRVSKLDMYIKGHPDYYCDDPRLPILERLVQNRKRLYTIEDITRILLHPQLQSSKFVCSKVPTSISESLSFVVDLDRVDNKDDILSDDMGVWRNNRVDTSYVDVTTSKYKVDNVKKCSPQLSKNTYAVKRVYRIHATDGSLRKLTAYLYSMSYYTVTWIEKKHLSQKIIGSIQTVTISVFLKRCQLYLAL